MTPDRLYQILAHLYGRRDTDLTVLPGRWATAADGPQLAGAWIAPGLEYHPAHDGTEMIITPAEAQVLRINRLIAWEGQGHVRAGATAAGRDRWNRYFAHGGAGS